MIVRLLLLGVVGLMASGWVDGTPSTITITPHFFSSGNFTKGRCATIPDNKEIVFVRLSFTASTIEFFNSSSLTYGKGGGGTTTISEANASLSTLSASLYFDALLKGAPITKLTTTVAYLNAAYKPTPVPCCDHVALSLPLLDAGLRGSAPQLLNVSCGGLVLFYSFNFTCNSPKGTNDKYGWDCAQCSDDHTASNATQCYNCVDDPTNGHKDCCLNHSGPNCTLVTTTAPPAPSTKTDYGFSTADPWVIATLAGGGAAVVLLIILIIVCCCLYSKTKKQTEKKQQMRMEIRRAGVSEPVGRSGGGVVYTAPPPAFPSASSGSGDSGTEEAASSQTEDERPAFRYNVPNLSLSSASQPRKPRQPRQLSPRRDAPPPKPFAPHAAGPSAPPPQPRPGSHYDLHAPPRTGAENRAYQLEDSGSTTDFDAPPRRAPPSVPSVGERSPFGTPAGRHPPPYGFPVSGLSNSNLSARDPSPSSFRPHPASSFSPPSNVDTYV